MIERRKLLLGLLASPAIIRTPGLLMAVKRPFDELDAYLRWRHPMPAPSILAGYQIIPRDQRGLLQFPYYLPEPQYADRFAALGLRREAPYGMASFEVRPIYDRSY